jgi:hypothetical protein
LRDRILKLLLQAVDELNGTLPADARLSKSEAQPLAGEAGGLDSLGWINLILLCEEKLQAELGVRTSLTDAVLLDSGGALPPTLGAFADLLVQTLEAA